MEPEQTYEELLFTSEDSYKVLEHRQKDNARTQMVVESGEAVQQDTLKIQRRRSKLLRALIFMVIFLLTANIIFIILFVHMSKDRSDNFIIHELQQLRSENTKLISGYLNCSSQCLQKKGLYENIFTFFPLGGKMYQNSYYFFSSRYMNWSESNAWCKAWNSHLVIISDNAEQKFLEREFAKQKYMVYWIGLKNASSEGVWKWVDNTICNLTDKSKTHFSDNEPDYFGNDDACAFISHDGKWGDASCSNSQHWICEKETNICST
ncbi:CD209 antigen-like protein E [Protopterus annectens]|uniref:CD209 antigen-like protein E n=1 Tax=Protopterus annectens TaxID=7888 RepID=UPI001CFC44B8|nr:CD209 antigen-like protein E [Protopterus annectens]